MGCGASLSGRAGDRLEVEGFQAEPLRFQRAQADAGLREGGDEIRHVASLRELDDLRRDLARLLRGDTAAACADLHELANRHPQNADVLALYGGALFELSVIGQARDVLSAALHLRPDHPEALNTMGAMAAELDHPEDAIGWFEDALEVSPNDLAARYTELDERVLAR